MTEHCAAPMDRAAWAATLRATSARTLGSAPVVPAPGTLRDERASTLAIDWVFFAAIGGGPLALRTADQAASPASNAAPTLDSLGPDERLWAACAGAITNIDALLAPTGEPRAAPRDPVPLFAQAGRFEAAIEVYTERLLCATHALNRLARTHERPDWHARATLCARWLLEHLQPDNATNYPWAVHVMVELALTSDSAVPDSTRAAADMYAQSLLHNCQVMYGKPDARSAWILWDAANELAGEEPRDPP